MAILEIPKVLDRIILAAETDVKRPIAIYSSRTSYPQRRTAFAGYDVKHVSGSVSPETVTLPLTRMRQDLLIEIENPSSSANGAPVSAGNHKGHEQKPKES